MLITKDIFFDDALDLGKDHADKIRIGMQGFRSKIAEASAWNNLSLDHQTWAKWICDAYVNDPGYWSFRMHVQNFFNGHVYAADANDVGSRLRFLKDLIPKIADEFSSATTHVDTYYAKSKLKGEVLKEYASGYEKFLFLQKMQQRMLAGGIILLGLALFFTPLVFIGLAASLPMLFFIMVVGVLISIAGIKIAFSIPNIHLNDTDFVRFYNQINPELRDHITVKDLNFPESPLAERLYPRERLSKGNVSSAS